MNIEKSGECDLVSDIIRIEQLNLYYEKHHALKNIGLSIKEKAVTAFIGPSGCGKSTLLRTLNRMNDMIPGTRIEGKVEIAGADIYGDDVEVEGLRQQVGMVFQQPNPFPKSIFENVAYGPRLQGIRSKSELEAIVERSLKQSALWEEVKDHLKKSAFSLSGGQQQRLCIARAIAGQPDILLMDEATSALDPISTLKIEELTQDLKKDYTIVMVTHNMHQAARISDQTAFFLNGEIVEATDTTEMFSNPSDSRTEDYISGRFG
ncbi:phosphate ABC transporter ATP-binding protein PstB [Paenibacillus hunanensis]|uniref:phosphate ABC transporter ATP-binding protein PstB n=1 Tax=Paenibacillus hunanensis TaxID=539262 RepID=UPI0016698531|nr:phosphate ABC transporter ATP-binding protein PstB [Paenibacillus hunanensis]MCL9659076.1 phosphate ABC transporter ATP-binding protein PstB [Paenibacillus hunanensis]WPP40115.1 phosphate ABC transporter ATP-binding protein PstB [Paenibacillus hunanensis]